VTSAKTFALIASAISCFSLPLPSSAQTLPPTPAPLPPAPKVFYLDGIALGSPITEYLSRHAKPTEVSASTYTWKNRQGGSLALTADQNGSIVLIDVKAGPAEVRSVDVLGRMDRFNDGGHINEPPPLWVPIMDNGDACGPSLKGSPCWGYLLPKNNELVMNFGGDNGGADWDLTEVFVGSREALITAKVVVNRSSAEAPTPWPTPSRNPEYRSAL
jgi:hypothetical protein